MEQEFDNRFQRIPTRSEAGLGVTGRPQLQLQMLFLGHIDEHGRLVVDELNARRLGKRREQQPLSGKLFFESGKLLTGRGYQFCPL